MPTGIGPTDPANIIILGFAALTFAATIYYSRRQERNQAALREALPAIIQTAFQRALQAATPAPDQHTAILINLHKQKEELVYQRSHLPPRYSVLSEVTPLS